MAAGRRDLVLNRLSAEVNRRFGYVDGLPAIDLGPCGPFALEFTQAWNLRFADAARLSYVIDPATGECLHVVSRLGRHVYFDGGFGVLGRNGLQARFPGSLIDDRVEFDLELLNLRAYGLFRPYERCPYYDHQLARGLIIEHLDELAAQADRADLKP